jgi:hypothetical protein
MSATLCRRWAIGLTLAGLVTPACIGAALPATAFAAVTASTITAPANNSEYFVDQTQGASTATALTVSGTVTGTGSLDVDCVDYQGHVSKLAVGVNAPGGSFSVAVSDQKLFSLTSNSQLNPCVLRAVPAGGTPADPGAATPFSGPDISISDNTFLGPGEAPRLTNPQDYYATLVDLGSGTTGLMEFDSDASCGLDFSFLYPNNAAMTESTSLFDCDGAIFDPYDYENTTIATPDEIQVDGKNATVADSYGGDDDGLPGWQPVAVTDNYVSGALAIQDNEPVTLCEPSCGFQTEPTSLAASGVELDRAWQTADNGLEAFQTDVFRSTDDLPHAVTVYYDEEFSTHGGNGSVDFPGTTGFAVPVVQHAVTLPSGAGAIYLKSHALTPDSGDGSNPQGAILYANTPTAAAVTTFSQSTSSGYDDFYLPYTVSVPAGGTATLRFAYIQDYALSDVKTMAQQALAGFDPALTIGAPSNGATLPTPQATVSGTAMDTAGIKSLTVDGAAFTIGSGGSFSGSVVLPVGVDTITVVATDTADLSTTQIAAVTVAMQTITSLGTKIKVGKLKAGKPHHYRLTGTLKLPTGVSAAQGCAGKITVTARRGRRKVATATATVSAKCTWSAKFTAKHLKGRGKLKVTVEFKGNAAIKPFTPKALKAKY